jgi:hypothetical protein
LWMSMISTQKLVWPDISKNKSVNFIICKILEVTLDIINSNPTQVYP